MLRGGRVKKRHTRVSEDRQHYLIPISGAPIHLEEGLRFVIGRRHEASLPLMAKGISRQHAEILWSSSLPISPLIRDINSRNGTFINERRVESKEGEEIRVLDVIRLSHDFSFLYQFCTASDLDRWLSDEARSDDTRKLNIGANTEAPKEKLPQGLRASLREVSAHSLFLFLEYSKVTGSISLSSGASRGQIRIRSGHPVTANFRSCQGAEAILAMSKLKVGHFDFQPE
jgi:hypothetical protein